MSGTNIPEYFYTSNQVTNIDFTLIINNEKASYLPHNFPESDRVRLLTSQNCNTRLKVTPPLTVIIPHFKEGLGINLIKKKFDTNLKAFVEDPESVRSTISSLPSIIEDQLYHALNNFYKLPKDFQRSATHGANNGEFKYTLNSKHITSCADPFCNKLLEGGWVPDPKRRCLYQFIPHDLMNKDEEKVIDQPILLPKIYTPNGIQVKRLWYFEEQMVNIYSTIFQIKQIIKHPGGLAFNIEFLKMVVYFPVGIIQLPDFERRSAAFYNFFQQYQALQANIVDIPAENSFTVPAITENNCNEKNDNKHYEDDDDEEYSQPMFTDQEFIKISSRQRHSFQKHPPLSITTTPIPSTSDQLGRPPLRRPPRDSSSSSRRPSRFAAEEPPATSKDSSPSAFPSVKRFRS